MPSGNQRRETVDESTGWGILLKHLDDVEREANASLTSINGRQLLLKQIQRTRDMAGRDEAFVNAYHDNGGDVTGGAIRTKLIPTATLFKNSPPGTAEKALQVLLDRGWLRMAVIGRDRMYSVHFGSP